MLSGLDADACRALFSELEGLRDKLDAEVEAVAATIPTLAALLDDLDPEARTLRRVHSDDLQRRALVEGEWEPYLADLREQGANYARLGMRFTDWYRLVRPYRSVLHSAILERDAPDRRQLIDHLERFLDVVLSTIGEVYLATKEDLIQQARERERLFHEMFRNASLGVVIYEWSDRRDLGSFRVVDANPASAYMSGQNVFDHIGERIVDSFPEMLDTPVLARYAEAITEQKALSWTISGGGKVFDVHCFPLHGDYVGVVFENVTERRRMAAELSERMRELERTNRELDDFAYVASHDLKAPLRDIDNLSAWALEDAEGQLPEASERHLERLRVRIRRMERLLDDLLAYSRSGRIDFKPEQTTLGEMVDEVLGVVSVPSSFHIRVEGRDVSLFTPKPPLALVLRNLIGNAVKHHDRGAGTIEIAAIDGEAGRISIAVTDDGPGIAERFRERAMRIFQTLRPRDEVEGSGVGLAIVKKVIEAHGGAVTIASAEPRGVSIRFDWPRHVSAETIEEAGVES